MDFVYAYSGVWMEVMLALDMIERYILALRLERSNQRNSELLLRGNLAQNVHIPHSVNPAFSDSKYLQEQ